MATQSQLVDDLVAETLRPDMLMMISSYVGQVIRELHLEPQSKAVVGLADNLVELEIISNLEEGFQWVIPRPQLFQGMAAVRYGSLGVDARQQRPQTINAFSNVAANPYVWYRSGITLAFRNYGGNNAKIQLAWYEYPRSLSYKSETDRQVSWNNETQEFDFVAGIVTDEQKAAALLTHTNWILDRHEELVKQGARAKLYARLGQYDRSRLAYSQYEALRPGFISAEAADNTAVYIEA